jgi:hypothetical protein
MSSGLLGGSGYDLAGTTSSPGTFREITNITFADTPYTVLAADEVILVNATGGAVVVNMPALLGTGREITVKKIDVSANFVTIEGNAAELIDGDLNPDLIAQYAEKTMVDGSLTEWSVV